MYATGKLNQETHHLPGALAQLEAGKRSLQRTVQALFREKLLHADQLIFEGTVAWLPLWNQQGVLRFEGLQLGRIGNCQLSGPIAYYRAGERPQPLFTAAALLARVVQSITGATPQDLQRLLTEVENSVLNDALCLDYRRGWTQRLKGRFGKGQQNFIAALRNSNEPNPALLLEQWGALGHPWHPNYKTKLGLDTQEVVAMSPEFEPALEVPVAAIREDVATLAFSVDGVDYRQWFADAFPQIWRRWAAALGQLGHDAANWLPLPLHPYQLQRAIPDKFHEELSAGELLLLPGVVFPAAPTMSFRTVVPEGSADLPHVKLPVSLRLTSVERTVSPKSAVMGPRLTRLIRSILQKERGFRETLDAVGEDVGLHYIDPAGDDDRARHLSVLFRANPMSKRTTGRFPLPVGALFAESPLNGRALATDLVSQSFGDHAQGAEAFFQCYCAVALAAMLGPYLLYGIAFEAHQQNSFMMVDDQHRPVQLLVRDFGDLRIHGPTLRQAGMELAAYRAGHTLFETDEQVRDKLLHAFMLCHLGELALLLSRAYHHPETHFWEIVRTEAEKAFEQLRPRTDAQRWRSERQALLEADWPAKSFLRMRLADSAEDAVGRMPNPLKTAA
jgi:siderophore synthetase component